MAKKYYAVRVGKLSGIFLDWENCSRAVKGVSGAEYKGFSDITDAERYLRGDVELQQSEDMRLEASEERPEAPDERSRISSKEESCKGTAYAFVDGSYNSVTHVYGYGGFLVDRGEEIILQGSGDEPEMASMRNVAGEILGSMAAVEEALRRGLAELTIYYDYMGIEMWATGRWKRNKEGTIRYHEYMRSAMKQIRIRFVKVKGHSGINGNERADRLAKEASGLV